MIILQQQFILYYSLIIYHDSINLVYIYHSLLIALQQYHHLYYFILDHDNFLCLVFLLSQLKSWPENYLNNQMQMDISIHLVQLNLYHIISFKQFIFYHFLILDNVTILWKYLYHYKPVTQLQSIHNHNHNQIIYYLVSLEFNHKQPVKQIQDVQEYFSFFHHTIHQELVIYLIKDNLLQYLHFYF